MKTKKTEQSEVPSILSKSFVVQGDIKSPGVLEIEGKVQGSVTGNSVIIRENGSIEGDVNVKNLKIHGDFNGNIIANEISIFKKAKIKGIIEYESLCVEDGASIEGEFKRISKNTPHTPAKNN